MSSDLIRVIQFFCKVAISYALMNSQRKHLTVQMNIHCTYENIIFICQSFIIHIDLMLVESSMNNIYVHSNEFMIFNVKSSAFGLNHI